MKPSVIADLGAVPAETFRDTLAVERGHLVRFVTPAVVDALADHVLWLSDIRHHPGGGVGVGLRGWEGGDVVALARPLRRGRGGGGPTLVHAEREIVVLVHGRIGGRDGDVAENLFEEGDPAGNKANVQVKVASDGGKIADA